MNLENKRGLIGKIFAIIGIIILIILIIAGITAWQAYSLYKFAMSESELIKSDAAILIKGDCSKIQSIESHLDKIKTKVQSACKNPIIRITIDKMQQIPYKCKDISSLESLTKQYLQPAKDKCKALASGNMTALLALNQTKQ